MADVKLAPGQSIRKFDNTRNINKLIPAAVVDLVYDAEGQLRGYIKDGKVIKVPRWDDLINDKKPTPTPTKAGTPTPTPTKVSGPSPMPMAGQVVQRPTPTAAPTVTATPTATPSASASSSASTSNWSTNIVSRAASQGVTVSVDFTPKAVDFWSTLDNKELTALASYLKKLGKSVKSKADLLDTISAYFPEAYKATSIEGAISALKDQIIMGFSGDQDTPRLPTKQITEVDPAVIKAVVRSVYQNKLGRNENADELAADLKTAQDMIKEGQVATTKVVGGKTQTTYTPAFSQERLQTKIAANIDTATEGPVAQDLKEKQSLDFMDFITSLGG
jgi:hypothetical protein